MIRPGRPRAIMPGAKTRLPWMTPQRLTARTRSQFSAGPNIALPGWMPALFMRRSVPPKRSPTAFFQGDQVRDAADVGFDRNHVGVARLGRGRDLFPRPGQPVRADIGDANAHAQSGEFFRGGEAYAGGAAGNDGDAALGKDGMGH